MKSKTQHIADPQALSDRLAKARREGRTQQALELARQLYKHNPVAEHLAMLREATFERGKHLQGQGQLKDAVTVYLNAADMGGGPEFVRELAGRLASCGAGQQALALLQRLPEVNEASAVLGRIADAALQQGPAGRATLPAALQAGYDQIVQAFGHAEKGKDDDARAALQSIGLQSPFLEWKLLLRGLLAWYGGDDAKALENWQRLDPERLPARVIAPLRAAIDPSFRAAQTPETQRALQRIADRLTGNGLAATLQAVQQALTKDDLTRALQLVQPVVGALAREQPALARRLADCFFWPVVLNGEERDIDRYQHLFGRLTGDPDVHRLRARWLEVEQEYQEAREHWQALEKVVAADSRFWPGDQGRMARALIWEHTADLSDGTAGGVLAAAMRSGRPPGRHPEFDRAAADLERSLQLAPERLGAYEKLVDLEFCREGPSAAIQAGERLLQRFPDHVPTLVRLGVLHAARQRLSEAQACFERALQVNPLDASVRAQLTLMHQHQALELLKKRSSRFAAARFAQARAHYEKALAYQDNAKTLLYVRLALLDALAGQTEQARSWLKQALAPPGAQLAAAHALRVEAARAKLPNEILVEMMQLVAPDALVDNLPEQIYRLIEIAATIGRFPKFPALKKHQKEALALLQQESFRGMSERQLAHACELLLGLAATKQCKWAITAGKRRFPANPTFRIVQGMLALRGKPSWRRLREARHCLSRAQSLAAELPREQRDAVAPLLHLFEVEIEYCTPKRESFGLPVEMFDEILDGFSGDDD